MDYIACRMNPFIRYRLDAECLRILLSAPKRERAARYKLVGDVSTSSGLGGVVADGAIRRCG